MFVSPVVLTEITMLGAFAVDRALDGDDRIGDLELGDAPLPEAGRIGLVGDDG